MIARRNLILGAAALATARTAEAAGVLTPRQTEGPFYPRTIPGDSDFDLTSYGGTGRPVGDVIDVTGRVYARNGDALPGAEVEIWHCDANGVYAHVDAGGVDPNFQGYGAVRTDRGGDYRFRTIRPGLYTGRTRHIHFKAASAQRSRLTTQMYFPGEPGNSRDFLLNRQRGVNREALISRFEPGDPPRYVFDIVLDI
jgi:protocatechuate 3,4-dioxygenase beta subunit